MKLHRLPGAIGAALLFALLTLVPAYGAEQSSYVTPTTGPMNMATFAGTYLNPALRALASCHNGASAPANGPSGAPLGYQCWVDTTSNPSLYKIYDGASWVTLGSLDTSTHVWVPYLTGGTSGGVPYFPSAGVMASSAALGQYAPVIGGGAGAAPSTITAGTDDQVLFGRTSNSPLFRSVTGDVTFSGGVAAIGANKVTDAMIRQSGALSLIGRSANSTGNVADIQASAGSSCAFRESSNSIGCGTLATAAYANNSVTDAKLRQSAALSLIGRSANSIGDVADITASAGSSCAFREASNSIACGTLATAALANNAVTNVKLAQMASSTVKCRVTSGTGDPEDCSASQGRSVLGLGSAAEQNTGTSGANVPLLNGNNTTSGNNSHTGTEDFQAPVKLSSFVTSTQITGAQNNYTATDGSNACSTKQTLRVSSDASRNITGLSCGQAEGSIRIIHNVGSFDVVLTNQDAGSTAANRFLLGGDTTLAPDTSITIRYDGVASRWRAITTPGAGGGGGGVSSVTCNGGATVITSSGSCASREILSANRTYYVATTGSDSNEGKATSTTGTVTFTNGSSAVGWTSHGRSVGDTIVITTTGTLSTNFATSTIYFVKTVTDANTIELSATSGGSAISAGSAGSGTHTATLLSPFLTIQKAIDVAAALDTSIYAITIYISGGTYTAANTMKRPAGGGTVTLTGMGATLTTVSVTSDNAFSCTLCGSYAINSMKLTTTTSGTALFVSGAGSLVTSNTGLEFGAAANYHIRAADGGAVRMFAYTISGSAQIHYLLGYNARVVAVSVTITLTGTPAFSSQFAKVQKLSVLDVEGVTWSGSATGTRYFCDTNSVLNTATGSSTTLPGNAAGTASTGCQYTSLELFRRSYAANDNARGLLQAA